MTSADDRTPMISPYCCRRGVAPTRNPVLRSCDVSLAMQMAMHTTAPTEMAATMPAVPVHPKPRKIRLVARSVPMVIPEAGFDVLPTSPTMLELTVTKKKLKITMSIAPTTLTGICGRSHASTPSPRAPAITYLTGRSNAVRLTAPLLPAPARATSFMPEPNDRTMVGMALMSVTSPPNATAPAPMYLM